MSDAPGCVTPETIAELRRLHAEATPGLWKLWGGDVVSDPDGSSDVEKGVFVCRPEMKMVNGHGRVFNAHLICEMQRALPSLLDAAEVAQLLGDAVLALLLKHEWVEQEVCGSASELCPECDADKSSEATGRATSGDGKHEPGCAWGALMDKVRQVLERRAAHGA